MLRSLALLVAFFLLLTPSALAQPAPTAPTPGGGATNVETTAPGGKSEVLLEFNNKVDEPEDVWVNGVKLEHNEWEWEAPGTGGKKLKIKFDNPPPADKKVEVRVKYPGAKPELSSATWS